MDNPQVKLVLQALRPNGQDAGQPVFAEAQARAAGDPELTVWWEAQQAFDRRVVAKLEEIAPPSDLRATILAGRKIEEFRPPPRLGSWLAAAAMLAILCFAGTLLQISASGPVALTEYTASVLPLLDHDAPLLGMTSSDHAKIAAWLKERNAPMGTLPGKMAALPTVGCQKFVVHGHVVSLICFAMAGGGLAHLFIVDRQALTDPPGPSPPETGKVQGWSTAAWSDQRMTYMLATQAGPDALKQLLGFQPASPPRLFASASPSR
jgi:hypothetical protein